MRYILLFFVLNSLFAQQIKKSAIQLQYSETITYRPSIVNNYDGILVSEGYPEIKVIK